jgi:hypothetical protein
VNPFRARSVSASPDFNRILNLPVRVERDPAALVREMTEALRTGTGTMTLRPVQALALFELMSEGGLFGPMGVGTGKTLVTMLAAVVLNAQRPLLLLPASLIQKTIHERGELMVHWNVSTSTRLLSYQKMGQESASKELELYRPDLIIADEVHKLKNKRAAVTRRVARYMADNPETGFVALSGTVVKNSLRDFAHIIRWCLGAENAPVPQTEGETEEWADALDERVQPLQRVKPGALLKLAKPGDIHEDDTATARKAFKQRLVSTPGVVASLNAEQVDCSIYIEGKTYAVNSATEANFDKLRGLWETPDGWRLSEAVEVWRHAKELALGFHYVWDPRPPDEWLERRRAWAKFVRDELSCSRTLDTEKQVRSAVELGELDDPEDTLARWKEIEPTFQVNQKAIWHDDTALDLCAAWMKREKGIVWTAHTFFGRELAKRTGCPYFGQNGRDALGREIDKDPNVTGPVIASIASCGTGKNLQFKWHKNLITSCPSGGDLLEQLLGRTHRPGQRADEVEVEILVGCIEHLSAWESARAEAVMSRDMLGQPQKLLLADPMMPTQDDLARLTGTRWRKVRQKKGGDE